MKLKDDTKVNLVFCATLKLILQVGVAGITMRQISREAKIATGTLYIYFKDKETLINALFEKCRASAIDIYFKGYNETDPFEKGFNKIWNNMLSYRIEHFDQAVFLDQCYHSPFITETAKEMNKRVLQPLMRLIERGKEENLLKDEDTFLLLTFMIGSVHELIKYLRYTGRKLNNVITDAAYKICWDGIKR